MDSRRDERKLDVVLWELSDMESSLFSQLVAAYREAAHGLAKAEAALKAAIAAVCAAHGLKGEWALSNDIRHLFLVTGRPEQPQTHE